MFKKLFFITFTLLFTLQSTSAVMDQYQSHDSDENPLVFDHGHDSNKNNETQKKVINVQASANQLDDHHCCHCHGVSQFFASAISNISSFTNVKMPIEYNFNPKLFSPSPNYRPPRV